MRFARIVHKVRWDRTLRRCVEKNALNTTTYSLIDFGGRGGRLEHLVLVDRHVMRDAVANELLFVMAIPSVLFSRRTLAIAFVVNDLVQAP